MRFLIAAALLLLPACTVRIVEPHVHDHGCVHQDFGHCAVWNPATGACVPKTRRLAHAQ